MEERCQQTLQRSHCAVRVGLGLALRRVLHDLNTHQNLNISRIWYVRRENGLYIKVVTWNPFYHGHLPSHLSFSGPLIIGLWCQGSVPAGWNNSNTNIRYFQNDNVCNIYNWQGKYLCVGQTADRYPELKNGVNLKRSQRAVRWVWVWQYNVFCTKWKTTQLWTCEILWTYLAYDTFKGKIGWGRIPRSWTLWNAGDRSKCLLIYANLYCISYDFPYRSGIKLMLINSNWPKTVTSCL